MKQKYIILIVVACLLLCGIATWFFGWYMPGKTKATSVNTDNDSTDTDSERELKNGDSGADVCRLQIALNKWRAMANVNMPNTLIPSEALTVDGIFGKKTQEAVFMFFGKNTCTIKELINLENSI